MAIFDWAANTSGDWNTGTLWTQAFVPNNLAANVTIDAATTLNAYTVTIAAGETETVSSLSMNGTNNFGGTHLSGTYVAAELELDGTIVFGPGSAGSLDGSLQTFVHEKSGSSAAILNGGRLDAFIQVEGNLLLAGANTVYFSNEVEALGGTVAITAPIGNVVGNTLTDGVFAARGPGAVINLGAASGPVVSIETIAASFGWTELTLDGPAAAITEWNGSGLVPVETTLRVIGAGAEVDILGGRDYISSASLTIDDAVGSSFFSAAVLNLQAGTVAVAGGININGGVVQGYGTIASQVFNNGTLIALGGTTGGTLHVTGTLTGTGSVIFDRNAATGGDPTEATLVLTSVSAGQTIIMNDGGDTLILASLSAFAGTIVAGMGGRIILDGLTATSAVLDHGTLIVSNGAQTVATLALGGSYAGDSFIASGSIVTILALPTISGTSGDQEISDQETISPFAGIAIADSNLAQTETVTVTLLPENGTLTNSGSGRYDAATGVYRVIGSASAVTTSLAGLVFVPTPHQVLPGQKVTTTFTISDTDTASQSAIDTTTTITTTAEFSSPTISGADADQAVSDDGTIAPFAHIQIADDNFGQIQTVTVTLSDALDGTLTNLGLGTYDPVSGIYVVSGIASAVTNALRALEFTPALHEVAPGDVVDTIFTIADVDTSGQFATDRTTEVAITATSVAPTISLTQAGQAVSDQATISPFANVLIGDDNFGQTETLTVTLLAAENGSLANISAGASYDAGTGVYTVIGSAAVVTSALHALVFVPSQHQVAPGQSVTTIFIISDIDTASRSAADSTTTVVSTAIAVQPSISPAGFSPTISDAATILPFADVVIGDANFGQQQTVTVTLSAAANGSLTNLAGGIYVGNGVYRFTGDASSVTAALNGLVFIPTPHQITPGTLISTTFTIDDIDTAAQLATDSTTIVNVIAGTSLPTITGSVPGQAVSDQGTIRPFAHVVIDDVNFGQDETLTVTLSTATNGTLSNFGAGDYDALNGVYTVTGSASAVTTALTALVFAPRVYQVASGQTVTTTFLIRAIDTAGQEETDDATSVVATALELAVQPTIGGAAPGQEISDQATVSPFINILIGDANIRQTETVTVTLSAAANGTLTNPGAGEYDVGTGVYTVSGTPSAVTTAVAALVFNPSLHQVTPSQTVSTTFTIADIDTASQMVSDSTTTVTVTATGVVPTIGGTASGQEVSDQATITPFAGVVISDTNVGSVEIQAVTTTFVINDTNAASLNVTDATTTVVATAVALLPVFNGAVAGQRISEQATILLFAGVTITDANFGQSETLTVTLSAAGNGKLTNVGGGTYDEPTGVYTISGSASAVTHALQGLVFIPTQHQAEPGLAVTTTFAIRDRDTAGQVATESTTTVIATAVAAPITIGPTATGQTTSDQAPIAPFAHVVITDANFGQIQTLTVTLSAPANGELSNPGVGSYSDATGVYTIDGTAAAVTVALAGLMFTPTRHQVMPGQTVLSRFTVTDTDTASQSATDSSTTVIAVAAASPPIISFTTGGQATDDRTAISPFTHVTITDPNFGQAETLTVTLSAATNGSLTNLGGGIYNAGAGVYTVTGGASAVMAALNALVFLPTQGKVAGGQRITTGFSLTVTDTAGASATNAATTVVATGVTPPQGGIILSGSSSQYIIANDNGSLHIGDTVPERNGTKTLSDVTVMVFADGTGLFDATGTAEHVARLYPAALGRAPDLDGLQAWTHAIDNSNVPLSAVATGFAASPEFIHSYGPLSDPQFVQRLYANVLHRPGDSAGLQAWGNLLASGATRGTVLFSFSESAEFRNNTVSIAGDLNDAEAYRLYKACLKSNTRRRWRGPVVRTTVRRRHAYANRTRFRKFRRVHAALWNNIERHRFHLSFVSERLEPAG